jgi:tetratricopeptide (TPR) repeat protein
MTRLSRTENFHLEAAQGWRGLGNWRDANEELEQISPRMLGYRDVLWARAEICVASKNWDLLKRVASALTAATDDTEAIPYMMLARAYFEVRRVAKARLILIGTAKMFKADAEVHYTLAVYHCRYGDLEGAMEVFETAVDISKTDFRQRALDDPALEPLWVKISEI